MEENRKYHATDWISINVGVLKNEITNHVKAGRNVIIQDANKRELNAYFRFMETLFDFDHMMSIHTKEEVIKIQFRKQFLNAAREGKIFAVNFGTAKVDLSNYFDNESGLNPAFFDLTEFKANPNNYTHLKDRKTKNLDLDQFPIKEGFCVVVMHEEEDQNELLSKLSMIPNIIKFGKLSVQ
jgi:hypothetical protein